MTSAWVSRRLFVLAAAAALVVAVTPVSAHHRDSDLLRRVAALEARVAALEAGGVPSPAPSPSPTSTPAVTPSPLSTPAPSVPSGWFGQPDPWAGLPFGSFPEMTTPASQQWRISGDQAGRVISRLTFRNRVDPGYLYLDGVRNLTVEYLDFDTVPEGIVVYNSTNVTIRYLRARNIFGPYTRTTSHTGNLLQIVNSTNVRVSDVKVDQPDTVPAGYTAWGTEDVISTGGCTGCWGGTSWDAPFLIERVAIDGGAWGSGSGTGIFIGDGASGRYVWVRDVALLNPGQTGIGTGEEGPYRFERIDILGQQRPGSNDSIQLRTDRAEFGRVRTDWRKPDGTKVTPNLGGHTFTDLGGNEWAATLDAAAIRALVAP